MNGANGAQGRNRTTDTRIFSPLLYRLSYLGLPSENPRREARKDGLFRQRARPVQPVRSGPIFPVIPPCPALRFGSAGD